MAYELRANSVNGTFAKGVVGKQLSRYGRIKVNKLRVSVEKFLMLYRVDIQNSIRDNESKVHKREIYTAKGNRLYTWMKPYSMEKMLSGATESCCLIDDIIIQGYSTFGMNIVLDGDRIKTIVLSHNELNKHLIIGADGKEIYKGTGDLNKVIHDSIKLEFNDKNSIKYEDGIVRTKNYVGTYEEGNTHRIVKVNVYSQRLRRSSYYLIVDKNTGNILREKVYSGATIIQRSDKTKSDLCIVRFEENKGLGLMLFSKYYYSIINMRTGKTIVNKVESIGTDADMSINIRSTYNKGLSECKAKYSVEYLENI